MKEIKTINESKAIEVAFYGGRIKDINLWLFGKVSLVACYNLENKEEPYCYFWRIQDQKKQDHIAYIGVFEKKASYQEHPYNKTLYDGDILFWKDEIYLYHYGFHSMELINPFGIINSQKILAALPPDSIFKNENPEINEVLDSKRHHLGYYWVINKDQCRLIVPFSPITYPDITGMNNLEFIPFKIYSKLAKEGFCFQNIQCDYVLDENCGKNCLKIDTSCYSTKYIETYIQDKVCTFSERCEHWDPQQGFQSHYKLDDYELDMILSHINACYGTEYSRENGFNTPQALANNLITNLHKRIFI